MHDRKQDVSLDFWRIVVPDDKAIKERIVQELHSTPYSAHPGIQRTIGKVQKVLLLERYAGRHKAVCGELSGVSDGEI